MGIKGRHCAADLKAVRPLRDKLAPPGDLTPAQKGRWEDITGSLPADAFRPGDAPLLRVFVIAEALYLEAAAMMARDGIVLVDAKGHQRAHPASSILTMQASAMAQVAMKLRLCPQARYETRGAAKMANEAPIAAKPWELQKSA